MLRAPTVDVSRDPPSATLGAGRSTVPLHTSCQMGWLPLPHCLVSDPSSSLLTAVLKSPEAGPGPHRLQVPAPGPQAATARTQPPPKLEARLPALPITSSAPTRPAGQPLLPSPGGSGALASARPASAAGQAALLSGPPPLPLWAPSARYLGLRLPRRAQACVEQTNSCSSTKLLPPSPPPLRRGGGSSQSQDHPPTVVGGLCGRPPANPLEKGGLLRDCHQLVEGRDRTGEAASQYLNEKP